MIDLADVAQISPFLVLAAGLLALPVTGLLLRRYRRSVVRLMLARGDVVATTVTRPDQEQARSLGAGLGRRAARRLTGHVAVTVGAAGFIGVTYAVLFLVWNDLETDPVRFTLLALLFSWPAVPGIWISTDGNRRWVLTAIMVYATAVVVVPTLGQAGPLDGLVGWAWFNALPTLVVIAFFTRPFKAVGICVLGLMLGGLVGSLAVLTTLRSDAAIGALVDMGLAAGVNSASALLLGLALVGFALAIGVGWLVFVRLGRWYSEHHFSDHMLLLGSLCFVFCIDYVAVVAASDPRALAVGLTLFAALGGGAVLMYRTLVGPRQQPARLLLLRVFDDGPNGPRLLNRVAARWRFVGPVRLIAGPDLATSTIEPDEFLTFMSGRLHRMFIDTPAALEERLVETTGATDPDGRFRLEEFFCFDTTWRAAVDALVIDSDAILLDLRGFIDERRGVAEELALLGRRGAYSRTVVVVDDRTDIELVESIVSDADDGRPTLVSMRGDNAFAVSKALFEGAKTPIEA